MNHYLIVFDRAVGQVLRNDAYTDRHEALRQRFQAERAYQGENDIEIVVLAADSPDALIKTHARYFKPLKDLLQSALNKTQGPPAGPGTQPVHS
ncbi:hypothetical protein ACQPZJ_10515 [Actinoplanes sp. CA-054009]